MQEILILSIFPEIFDSFIKTSLIAKAINKRLLQITCKNIRDFASPPHYHVDDTPYGGGPGMLMKPEPLASAIKAAKDALPSARVILFSASGKLLKQVKAEQLSAYEQLILVCARYEGVDQRVIDLYVDEVISIGDYVLMGGEVPAMVLIEACARLRPDIIGNSDSLKQESFSKALPILESPHYTRPEVFEGLRVPQVLLSGDHQAIADWRKEQSIKLTKLIRPELITSEN